MIYAPEAYKKLTQKQAAAIINGCGPGGWKIDLVPDTLWGLNITDACDIHDYMYHVGDDIKDKEEADRVFLNNMIRLVNAGTKCRWLRLLRRHRANIYYSAVKKFGGPAFWAEKNQGGGI